MPISLANSRLFGSFNASGMSDTFTLGRADFTVRLTFADSATGIVTAKRSIDGVTFAPVMAGSRQVSTRSNSGKLHIFETTIGALWRLECTLQSGSIDFDVLQGGNIDAASDICFLNLPPSVQFGIPALNPSDAQMQKQLINRFTPLADDDIAGDLVVYKICSGNNFAKLIFPAAAQRCKGPFFLLGSNRELRAEYAKVVSVFDGNGVALSSVTSAVDPSTTYTPGSQVTARDLYGNSTGAFTSATYRAGIYAYPTLLEAAASHLSSGSPMPNLNALGL